jgi:DNA-binding FrmR family transcriptional regulator
MAEDVNTDADALLTRLRRIEGQIRGIHRMLAEGRMCEDVLTQLMAVRSGIDQVGLHVMDHHIEQCLLSGVPADAGLRNLQQTLRLWLRFGGPVAPSD